MFDVVYIYAKAAYPLFFSPFYDAPVRVHAHMPLFFYRLTYRKMLKPPIPAASQAWMRVCFDQISIVASRYAQRHIILNLAEV